MITINLVVFLLVLQVLLLAVLLAALAVVKVRRLSARLAARRALPDAALYLATELQRTRERLDDMGGAPAGAAPNSNTASRLALRAELLQLEVEWSGQAQHDAEDWGRLDARLHDLLALEAAAAPSAAEPPAATPADTKEVDTKRLFDEHHVTIEYLKAGIATAVSNPDTSESLQAQLDNLGRTARELTFCVTILEDENQFLRDQVRALLQQE
jgi:hypothetical protein